MTENAFNVGDIVNHPVYGRGIVKQDLITSEYYVEFLNEECLYLDDASAGLRRLAVIDPESDEDVKRLWASSFADLRAALRAFANPATPPLEEPTDLAARVKDRAGSVWACVGEGYWTKGSGRLTWREFVRTHGPLSLVEES